jgi:hypothetical protein
MKSFVSCKGRTGSQFWEGIHKVKEKFCWGAKFVVNNGRKAMLWENVWLKEDPLKKVFLI